MRADSSLREYAARLGEVRDLQVLREVLTRRTTGALAGWVEHELAALLRAAWQRLERELEGPDQHRLTDHLTVLALGPAPDDVDVRRCVKKARKQALRRLADAGDDPDLLHDARKAAKRARYAAEATGRPRQVRRFQRLQELLGTHHDLVVAGRWLEQAALPLPLRAEAGAVGVRLSAEGERARRSATL